jgi:hypothetical protein
MGTIHTFSTLPRSSSHLHEVRHTSCFSFRAGETATLDLRGKK